MKTEKDPRVFERVNLSVDIIDVSPYNPRKNFDEERLQELSQSIREVGVLQPLVVTKGEQPGRYLLIAGERRLRAAKMAGLTHILIECNHAADILNENVESGAVPAAMRRRVMRSHMSLSTVKGFLKANSLSAVREIRLIHLSDGNSDAERFKNEIQALTGRPVYVAEK